MDHGGAPVTREALGALDRKGHLERYVDIWFASSCSVKKEVCFSDKHITRFGGRAWYFRIWSLGVHAVLSIHLHVSQMGERRNCCPFPKYNFTTHMHVSVVALSFYCAVQYSRNHIPNTPWDCHLCCPRQTPLNTGSLSSPHLCFSTPSPHLRLHLLGSRDGLLRPVRTSEAWHRSERRGSWKTNRPRYVFSGAN